jgi:hypothetical protein
VVGIIGNLALSVLWVEISDDGDSDGIETHARSSDSYGTLSRKGGGNLVDSRIYGNSDIASTPEPTE